MLIRDVLCSSIISFLVHQNKWLLLFDKSHQPKIKKEYY